MKQKIITSMLVESDQLLPIEYTPASYVPVPDESMETDTKQRSPIDQDRTQQSLMQQTPKQNISTQQPLEQLGAKETSSASFDIAPDELMPFHINSDRLIEINNFIQKQGLDGNVFPLAKDMSNRFYYRLMTLDKSFVIMDAPFPEKPAQFVLIADFLLKQGVRAPEIYAFDEEKGLVLIEDFGDKTFTRLLDAAFEIDLKKYHALEKLFYQTATQVLLSVTKTERPMAIEEYSTQKLLLEVEVFIDWYWPFAKGGTAPSIAKHHYMTLWQELFDSLPATPKSIVHRDFHADNIIIISDPLAIKTCGVLDFQDAVWGSVVYDFISLLEDARRDVSPDVVEHCSKLFLNAYPIEMHDALEVTAKVLAVCRHVKVIGVFTRYALRQNNTSKCQHLPRLWRYLEQHFKDPIFAPLSDWFAQYFPIARQYQFLTPIASTSQTKQIT